MCIDWLQSSCFATVRFATTDFFCDKNRSLCSLTARLRNAGSRKRSRPRIREWLANMLTLPMQSNIRWWWASKPVTLHLHVWFHAKRVTVCHIPWGSRPLCVLTLRSIPCIIRKNCHLSRFNFLLLFFDVWLWELRQRKVSVQKFSKLWHVTKKKTRHKKSMIAPSFNYFCNRIRNSA